MATWNRCFELSLHFPSPPLSSRSICPIAEKTDGTQRRWDLNPWPPGIIQVHNPTGPRCPANKKVLFAQYKKYIFNSKTIRAIVVGLLFNDGDSWKSHRRFSLKTLKDFGFGKKSLESVLLEEADRMVDFFVEKKQEPVYVQTLFNLAILNVLWTIVAGKR